MQTENQESIVVEREIITEEKPKKKKNWFLILMSVFLLVGIFVLGWLCYQNGYFQTKQEIIEEEVEITEEKIEKQVTTLQDYLGTFFSTKHPIGWKIVEYFDGEGTTMLYKEEQYIGLTGLKIFLNDKEIFALEGVTGIGFLGCPDLGRFPDNNPAYEQEQKDMGLDIMVDTEILDYTNVDFSSFKWFDKDFRRVDKLLFYDTIPNNQYFEPQCELAFLSITEFSYTDSNEYKSNAYHYNINDQATQEELNILDGILENMVKKQ